MASIEGSESPSDRQIECEWASWCSRAKVLRGDDTPAGILVRASHVVQIVFVVNCGGVRQNAVQVEPGIALGFSLADDDYCRLHVGTPTVPFFVHPETGPLLLAGESISMTQFFAVALPHGDHLLERGSPFQSRIASSGCPPFMGPLTPHPLHHT